MSLLQETEKQSAEKEAPTEESEKRQEKSRRTFFFNKPTPEPSMGAGGRSAGEVAPTPSQQRLEGFSEVQGEYDVDFDGRLEELDEKNKKKKRKRKKKDGDDSD